MAGGRLQKLAEKLRKSSTKTQSWLAMCGPRGWGRELWRSRIKILNRNSTIKWMANFKTLIISTKNTIRKNSESRSMVVPLKPIGTPGIAGLFLYTNKQRYVEVPYLGKLTLQWSPQTTSIQFSPLTNSKLKHKIGLLTLEKWVFQITNFWHFYLCLLALKIFPCRK